MVDSVYRDVSINDLINCGYEEIISACEPDVEEYLQALSRATKNTRDKDEVSKSYALELLSAACSLMLRASNSKMPFEPRLVLNDGSTSFKPSDLPSKVGGVLAEFASQIQCSELASRLADLSWITKRNINSAKTAIAGYIDASNSEFCRKRWYEKINRLERALRLSFLIKDKSFVDVIRAEFISLLESSHESFSYIAVKRISGLLLEFELMDANLLGDKILSLIELHGGSSDFQYKLFSMANRAFLKGKSVDKAKDVKVKGAEALAIKAEQNKRPGNMIAASHWYSQAIAAFQQCEGQQDRVVELQREIEVVNRECHKEMQSFSIETDITDMVNQATAAMQNKTIENAVIQFAYLCGPLPRKKLEKETIRLAQSTIFQTTAAKSILNGDGRLVAIIPPLIGSKAEDYDLALKWGCYQQASHHHLLITNGAIIPARNELLRLHQIDEESLDGLLKNCQFFPAGRAKLWVKGFVFGFYNDFDAALCLLMPQFEHALRKCLEARGAVVWRVDPVTKFHSEKSLGELLNLPEACEFLGEDLQFELQGLLTERVGFNFRNEALHGLASEASFYSPEAVYLWWLLFHVAIRLSQFSSQ